MRFLLIPSRPHPYDQRMMSGLGRALRAFGHEVRVLPSPIEQSLLASFCLQMAFDVVLQVNRTRPLEPPLPPDVRHITWMQDVYPDDVERLAANSRENDIVYALGDPTVLGINVRLPCQLSTLMTGVEELERKNSGATSSTSRVDFSLVAFIPPPLEIQDDNLVARVFDPLARVPVIGNLMSRTLLRGMVKNHIPSALRLDLKSIIDLYYRPLSGELDIHDLAARLQEAAEHFCNIRLVASESRPNSRAAPASRLRSHFRSPLRSGYWLMQMLIQSRERENTGSLDRFIEYLVREYPRLLDRTALVQDILAVSESLELYGPGWDSHEQFRPYHCGVLTTPLELAHIFRRSRINLANNTHGIGLHSRTLECMAVGGFILTHRSPHDDKPGGMLTSFEPEKHYGVFTPETLREEASRWLHDDQHREEAGLRAAEIIEQKHLWHHRAQQIIDDLRR